MQIRHIKDFTRFINQCLQDVHALFALHTATESAFKGGAMSGHVDFGNQGHEMFPAEVDQFACFLLCVIFSRHTRRMGAVVKCRIAFAFESPCLIFGQMPMKCVDFVTGQ